MNSNGLSSATKEWIVSLTAQQLTVGLLGRLLLEYPDRQWLELLAREGVFGETPLTSTGADVLPGAELLKRWTEENGHSLDDDAFEDVVLDYNRLFVGPDEVFAPPWESVYFNENRLTLQEETLAVRRWYRRFGLESLKVHNEPDDHVGLELSFLAYLIGKTIEALEQEGSAGATRYLEAQRQFIAEHLGKWIDLWAERVQAEAKTDFWPGVALLAEDAVFHWHEWLAGKIPQMVAT